MMSYISRRKCIFLIKIILFEYLVLNTIYDIFCKVRNFKRLSMQITITTVEKNSYPLLKKLATIYMVIFHQGAFITFNYKPCLKLEILRGGVQSLLSKIQHPYTNKTNLRALRASCTSCHTCSSVSRVSCPTCCRASRALVLHLLSCLTCLVAYVLACLACLVSSCSCASYLTSTCSCT